MVVVRVVLVMVVEATVAVTVVDEALVGLDVSFALQQMCLKLLFAQSMKSQNFGSFLLFFFSDRFFSMLNFSANFFGGLLDVLNGWMLLALV